MRSVHIVAEKWKKELMAQNKMSCLMFMLIDNPLATKVGKFVRRISIDESPQFNVLKGNMGLVALHIDAG